MVLSLHSAYDAQVALRKHLKKLRKSQKISVKSLSELSGVPNSTIRRFEETGEISLRQFLSLYFALSDIEDIIELTKKKDNIPKNLEDLIDD